MRKHLWRATSVLFGTNAGRLNVFRRTRAARLEETCLQCGPVSLMLVVVTVSGTRTLVLREKVPVLVVLWKFCEHWSLWRTDT